MPKPIFIVSLDCEGKWGMADRIDSSHDRFLTTGNLVEIYRRIIDLFQRYDIVATFAFVMAFALTHDEFRRFRDHFTDVDVEGGNWLRYFRKQEAQSFLEGWSAPQTLDLVRGTKGHEIGCHGFSHLPLGLVSRTQAAAELESAGVIARHKGLALQTFVYPRNLVAHTDVLGEQGYIGFRDRLPQRSGLTLLDQMNPFTRSQQVDREHSGIIPIPAGHFLHWRYGIRQIVPSRLTLRRWRHIIDHAIATNGVAHLWLHPHNLITAPTTFEVLANILEYAAHQRDLGWIANLTQEQYCRQLLSTETAFGSGSPMSHERLA